ncbi:MAG TPA: hypothetical protein VGP24_12445 [Glaciihabitans sp.]|jgi:hypothetical protein|nr:hypothetical protein [Glaciihabitans sp.]
MSLELAKLAYLAGVLDTQGGIKRRAVKSGVELPMVYVHRSDVRVLQHLADLTGTKVTHTARAYAKHGCSVHCPDKHQHVTSHGGRWSLTGVRATVFLWNVRPYLVFLAEEAAAAITLGLSSPFKPATPQRMAELGWELPDFRVI